MNAIKLTTVLGLTALMSVPLGAQAGMKGNFLLGVEGGYASRSGELKTSIRHPAPGSQLSDNSKSHNDSGGIWGILGGYQVKCHNFLLGLEAGLSWQDIGDTQNYHFVDSLGNHHSARGKHERDTVYALTVRAGYQLTPWMMPYIRAGAEGSDEKIRFSASDVTTPKTVVINNSRHAVRFIGGAGLEFPLIADATLRFEYNYSSRGRGAAGGAYASDNVTFYNANIKPNQHAGKVALVWNFR